MTRRALAALALPAIAFVCLIAPGAASAAAVDGDGMWIWYVSKSSGGTADGIAAKAAKHGVETVYIKSADARSRWKQFSPKLVGELKARGLRVCAWQFVYGRYPKTEAERAAEAARIGADCIVIDAEGHYEGKYISAQSYIKRLRSRVGPKYEVALTSFPYVHYHPGLPYSVFLGPGAAQENLPQMYWKTIGTSVDRVYSTTYTYNRVYQRPIFPLGQTYENPSSASVRRFRVLATAYGAKGVSWWVWQFSRARQWNALGSAFDPLGVPRKQASWPLLKRKYRSDLVVWAQQHLMSLGLLKAADGKFGTSTQTGVIAFQVQQGLVPSGRIDKATWQRLLATADPAKVKWGRKRAVTVAANGTPTLPTPVNARRGAVRDELAGKPGR